MHTSDWFSTFSDKAAEYFAIIKLFTDKKKQLLNLRQKWSLEGIEFLPFWLNPQYPIALPLSFFRPSKSREFDFYSISSSCVFQSLFSISIFSLLHPRSAINTLSFRRHFEEKWFTDPEPTQNPEFMYSVQMLFLLNYGCTKVVSQHSSYNHNLFSNVI